MIDRASEAFHQALGTHMDYVGASCCRADDWVSAPVPAVVEVLLLSGWVPPQDEAGDLRQVPRCRSRRPMCQRRGSAS
jgi:hypothetical protein